MATGLTGKDDLYFYEEKIALKEEKKTEKYHYH